MSNIPGLTYLTNKLPPVPNVPKLSIDNMLSLNAWGIPIATIGLVGITSVVLAYITLSDMASSRSSKPATAAEAPAPAAVESRPEPEPSPPMEEESETRVGGRTRRRRNKIRKTRSKKQSKSKK